MGRDVTRSLGPLQARTPGRHGAPVLLRGTRRWSFMKGLRALIAALCVLVVVSVPRAEASSFGWAGVVIVHGDGSVKVDCVALDRREMTGFRLLRISRFPVRYAN